MCAAGPTPQLNLRFEPRPSWNYIHDTFPTGTAQDIMLVTSHRNSRAEWEPSRCALFGGGVTSASPISAANTSSTGQPASTAVQLLPCGNTSAFLGKHSGLFQLSYCCCKTVSRGGSVGTANRLTAGRIEVRIPAGARGLSLLQNM